jgi:hypothetical protein
MAPTRSNSRLVSLAPAKYALLSPIESAGLDKGRERFLTALREKKGKVRVSENWIISQDLGRLINLWERCLDETTGLGPILAHDILALHGLHPTGAKPRFYSKEVLKDLMHPKDAYALPIKDYAGKRIATLVHVGPDALEKEVTNLINCLETRNFS